VDKCDKPSLEELHRVQKLYIDELTRFVGLSYATNTSATSTADTLPLPSMTRIWHTYKNQFAKARRRELNIID
jgi:2-acylglycerol O-acyltransferase 2